MRRDGLGLAAGCSSSRAPPDEAARTPARGTRAARSTSASQTAPRAGSLAWSGWTTLTKPAAPPDGDRRLQPVQLVAESAAACAWSCRGISMRRSSAAMLWPAGSPRCRSAAESWRLDRVARVFLGKSASLMPGRQLRRAVRASIFAGDGIEGLARPRPRVALVVLHQRGDVRRRRDLARGRASSRA